MCVCVCAVPQVTEELQSGPMSAEEKELLHLLTSPHLKVANGGVPPVGPLQASWLGPAQLSLARLFSVPRGCLVGARHRGPEEL